MRTLLALTALAIACSGDPMPFAPPAPEDASTVPLDAMTDVPAETSEVILALDVPPPPDVPEDRTVETGSSCRSMTVGNCCGVACEVPPRASATCVQGRCGLGGCMVGYGDCDGVVANGCETNLTTTTAHCGACGAPCAAGRACVAALCAVAPACPMGFADCDGVTSNGCEADLRRSVLHCGRCGFACLAPRACVDGACETCTGGTADCDGNRTCETNLLTNRDHCGACGRACGASQICDNASCRAP